MRQLTEAILDGGLRPPAFFNGRLLAAEDLIQLYAATRDADRRLGKTLGDGVAFGLEVSVAAASTKDDPAITIAAGLAVNRKGQALLLSSPVEVALLLQADTPASTQASKFSNCTGLNTGSAPGPGSDFRDCTPLPVGTVVAGVELYLLVLAPASGGEGLAEVSGLGNDAVRCNVRSAVEGVQFRVLPLRPPDADTADPALMRGRVAHRILGTEDILGRGPGDLPTNYGLLDTLRPKLLTDCVVPLALLHLTVDGLGFVDLWSVRRRVTAAGTAGKWGAVSDRRLSEAEAGLLQFQEQIAAVLSEPGAATLTADMRFIFLPPGGVLPTGANAFDWKTFLGPHAPLEETPIDRGLLRSVLHQSLAQDPIRVANFSSTDAGAEPAPLVVYRVPGESSFVVFARSARGRVRVFLNPLPASGEVVQISASRADSNQQWFAAIVAGKPATMPALAPGAYAVHVAVTNYFEENFSPVEAVGGATTDRTVNLRRLPNGSILLTVRDSHTQQSIGNAVTGVVASSSTGDRHDGAVVADTGQWMIPDLPSGTYDVTVTARDYATGKVTGIAVALAQQATRDVALDPAPTINQPPGCIFIETTGIAAIPPARFCMVVDQIYLPRPIIFLGVQTASIPPLLADMSGVVSVAPSAAALNVKKALATTDTSELGRAIEFESLTVSATVAGLGRPWWNQPVPWSQMTKATQLPTEATAWLGQWQTWLNLQHPGFGIDRSVPTIYLTANYTIPRLILDYPLTPRAYAVFGNVGVPLTVTPRLWLPKRPIIISKERFPGLSDVVIGNLDRGGIRYVDQIAGGWAENIAEVAGESVDFGRYLMDDAVRAVGTANTGWGAYEGVNETVTKAFAALGINDDVALANTDPTALRAALDQQMAGATPDQRAANAGLAFRLVSQSRDTVPQDAWSLGALGLTVGQVDALGREGVTTKLGFSEKARTADGIAQLAGVLQTPSTLVADLHSTALAQLTASSVKFSPTVELQALPGVNSDISTKLYEGNIKSSSDLANAAPSDVARVAGVSEDSAKALIAAAGAATPAAMPVENSAALNATESAALKAAGVTTIGGLATADATKVTAIRAALGDTRANALINGAQLGLKLGIH